MFFYILVTITGFLIFLFHSHVSYIPFLKFFYIPMFCSNMSSYPATLSRFLFFFNYNNHVSYIPVFCLNMVAKYSWFKKYLLLDECD